MIIEMLALALLTQVQDGNQWERGTDPVTSAGGIRNILSDVFITCVPQSGVVHITMNGQPAYRLFVTSGELDAEFLDLKLSENRSHIMIDAADPALEAAASTGRLKVARHTLGFSDHDRANYKLLVTRICRKPAE